ncbi:MAG: 23S rRNA (pseudouridine(1915)-N(3))-methyltransferase RlmH [Oscillospiraceae bacterium]|jgi:23S rRNA (pseudouridine1915-N3)-methyltransferase|nr:23S rRNA (pseudouridine(1915)-N(3))-methyltransferase RlmH [Oscillospiraceae bacterium]
MRRIKLICFGKLKEPHWRQACAEYEKRLQAFCRLETVELPPAALPDAPSAAQIEQALLAEAKLAWEKIPKDAGVAALCVEGRQLSSEQFAAWLGAQPNETAIVVGSSFGLHESVKTQAQLRLSLSHMTFPRQLARVNLLEQIYRAFQIQTGGKYHK